MDKSIEKLKKNIDKAIEENDQMPDGPIKLSIKHLLQQAKDNVSLFVVVVNEKPIVEKPIVKESKKIEKVDFIKKAREKSLKFKEERKVEREKKVKK